MVKTVELLDSVSPERNQAMPTPVMSSPKRLRGRRHQAKTPVPMKLSPMSGPRMAVTTFWSSCVEVSARATSRPAKITPRAKRASRARRRPGMPGLEQLGYGCAGEIALGDEASGAASGYERAEVGRVAAGGQDHGRSAVVGRDPLGDLEAVEVREVDVEKHQIRVQAAGLHDGRRAVRSLADHVVALGLQQHPGGGPEGRMIVDYENGGAHL